MIQQWYDCDAGDTQWCPRGVKCDGHWVSLSLCLHNDNNPAPSYPSYAALHWLPAWEKRCFCFSWPGPSWAGSVGRSTRSPTTWLQLLQCTTIILDIISGQHAFILLQILARAGFLPRVGTNLLIYVRLRCAGRFLLSQDGPDWNWYFPGWN